MALYAIGDIHGCNRSFQALLRKIELQQNDELVLVGDYIDRGPDSKGVLDTIFKLRQAGFSVHCLRGNHEQLFIEALTAVSYTLQRFLGAGGRATLKSFDVKAPGAIEDYYIDFITNLPNFLELDSFLFVHGGINFSTAEPLSDQEAMLWARYWYDKINYRWLGERIIIHGHTPISLEEHVEMLEQCREGNSQVLNLDTGCVYAQEEGLGLLSAVNLETFEGIYQWNIDE